MKKFISCLVACVALTQFSYAAESPLANSLIEYDAIVETLQNNPAFEGIIGANEFIVDIARTTKCLDILGKVHYRIVTRDVNNCHLKKCYCVTLIVSPNPEFETGPRIAVVVSIKPDRCRRECERRCDRPCRNGRDGWDGDEWGDEEND